MLTNLQASRKIIENTQKIRQKSARNPENSIEILKFIRIIISLLRGGMVGVTYAWSVEVIEKLVFPGRLASLGGGGAVDVDGWVLVLGPRDHQSISVRTVTLQRWYLSRSCRSRCAFTFAFGRRLNEFSYINDGGDR